MATLQERTTSNYAAVSNPEQAASVIDEYHFAPGAFDAVDASVTDDGNLSLFGNAGFCPVPEDDLDEDGYPDIDRQDPTGFLASLAPHLEEPLIVQYSSNEKLRFPMGSAIWVVRPGDSEDDVEKMSFHEFQQQALEQ